MRGLAGAVEGQPVELRLEGVREPGRVRGEDDVVDHGGLRAEPGEVAQQGAGAGVDDADLPAPAAGEVEPPLGPVDLESDGAVPGAEPLVDDPALAGGQGGPVRGAVDERAEVGVRAVPDRDALRLEAPREGGPGGPPPTGSGRVRRACGEGSGESRRAEGDGGSQESSACEVMLR
ncbi:hypothetical protein [Streptomyces globisporus]|uniref:hypothetical protein n=1 Tax=Streptomyces globisporus TaxID=1908 RepID=UPI00131D3467|nr:hypothetical protein [Streptomyces globisporus]